MTGPVSTIRGRRQGPALRAITLSAWILGGLGALTARRWSDLAATVALVLVTATPLLRVGWLIIRWEQERDWRFVAAGVGLLALIGAGAATVYVGGRGG